MKKKGKWSKHEGQEAKTGKRAAIFGLIAALALSTTSSADGKESTFDKNMPNATIYGNHAGDDFETQSGAPCDNKLTIVAGTKTGNVYGASGADGQNVENNKVIVEGGEHKFITGGNGSRAELKNNSVEIKDGIIKDLVYGALTDQSSTRAYDNQVKISGGTFSRPIWGAYVVAGGESIGNSVEISGGNFEISPKGNHQGIIGGYAQGAVSNNQVIIGNENTEVNSLKVSLTNGTYEKGFISGGHANSGASTGNTVDITNATVVKAGSIYGGSNYNNDSPVEANVVCLKNAYVTISDANYGAVAGGRSNVGIATDNEVHVDDHSVVTGRICGGIGAPSATNNTVYINNSTLLKSTRDKLTGVYGGMADGHQDDNKISDNRVYITDSEISGKVAGGHPQRYAATNTFRNEVYLENTTVRNAIDSTGNANFNVPGNVYGGYSFDPYVDDGKAIENKVYLSGNNNIEGDVAGGYAFFDANDNLVSIKGSANINGDLMGGHSENRMSEGNTLEVYHENATDSIDVGGLSDFQNLKFAFSPEVKDGTIMVKVENEADVTDSEVKIFFSGATTPLQINDRVILIDADHLEANQDEEQVLNSDLITATLGVSLDYHFHVYATDDNKLVAELTDIGGYPDPPAPPSPPDDTDDADDKTPADVPEPTLNPQTKALSEGWLAGMTQIIRAGDLVVDSLPGINESLEISRDKKGCIPFAAIDGNRLRFKTGSHIDTRGTNIVAGVTGGKALKDGGTVIGGIYLEYGKADYDTHNEFIGKTSVYGAGDIEYVGGGVLGRVNFASRTDAHTYVEATLRGGRIRNHYDSRTLKDAMGTVAAYRAKAGYMAGHAALGRLIELNDGATLDLKGSFLWARMNGAETRLTTGETIDFSAVNSARVKLGARLTGAPDRSVRPYAGFAMERELDATVRASVYGYKIEKPTLKGTTAAAEAGILVNPGNRDDITLELGVKAHVGRRQGVTGGLKFTWRF